MEFSQDQKTYAEIVHKAWEDVAFKEELIANPVLAIEKITGKKMILPIGKTLIVRDQTDESTVYINIPARLELDAELNEEELDIVSGGIIDGPGGCCYPTYPDDWNDWDPWKEKDIIFSTK